MNKRRLITIRLLLDSITTCNCFWCNIVAIVWLIAFWWCPHRFCSFSRLEPLHFKQWLCFYNRESPLSWTKGFPWHYWKAQRVHLFSSSLIRMDLYTKHILYIHWHWFKERLNTNDAVVLWHLIKNRLNQWILLLSQKKLGLHFFLTLIGPDPKNNLPGSALLVESGSWIFNVISPLKFIT